MDAITELVDFLNDDVPPQIKRIAMDSLLGIADSLGEDANPRAIGSIVAATFDRDAKVAETALKTVVNISTTLPGIIQLLYFRCDEYGDIINVLTNFILNPKNKNADAACMALTNITRCTAQIKNHINSIIPHLHNLIHAYVHIGYNKKGCTLNYLGHVFLNLSRFSEIRKWLTEEHPHVPLLKLLPFFNYAQSNIRRGGSIGLIRNLSLDPEFYDFLLCNEIELLTYLLTPIMGNEDYPDDEMDKLPITLQYLPQEKERDFDPDIRLMVLETLNQICMKRKGREFLRDNGVYYVLREHHKWETDSRVKLACENVVDILIQKEEEVGVEDFSTLDVPDDLKEKFEKMDQDYLKEN